MTPEIDESSLTAYALGELSGAERAAVAAHLVSNAGARRYVADVRATAHLLADELARESFGGLTDLQHAAIEQKLEDAMRISRFKPRVSRAARWNRAVFAMSLAASIMIVCGVVSVLIPFVYRNVQISTYKAPPVKPGPTTTSDGVQPPAVARSGNPEEMPSHDPSFDSDSMREMADDVPQPDRALVTKGSSNEESVPPRAVVGNRPPTVVLPGPSVVTPVPHVDPPVVATQKPLHDPVGPVTPPVPRRKGDGFAEIPPNAVSPDKVHTVPGSSADGMLPSGEQYAHLLENPYIDTAVESVSGFSAGVDTASYSNIRRFLTHGALPPRDAVRIEEMLNYFPIHQATALPGNGPLALQVELGACPWRPECRLARVCLQARELPPAARPPVNLVFVIDTSASMRKEKTKLRLLKQAIRQLVGELSVSDRVTLVAYSHEAQVVLPPTAADDKQDIWNALDRLEFVPETIGGQGMEVAYEQASRNFLRGGINRVVLATDGNWTIGTTDRAGLAAIVADRAKNKISLTVLGVGMDNLKDDTLQKLALAGNGSYAYIDTLAEARKVLDDQINGALVTVARDVKVQVTFNKEAASSFRLLGYERRALSMEELKSQSHPGGEMGAGQSVTALYEVLLVPGKASANRSTAMVTATATYADPGSTVRESLTAIGEDHATPLPRTTPEFRFAAAVAEFGLMLRDSEYKGNATYSSVLDHVHEANFGQDETGYRREFVTLIQKAKALSGTVKQDH